MFEIATSRCKASAAPPTTLTRHRLLHRIFNLLPNVCCSAKDVCLEFLPSDTSIIIRVELVKDAPQGIEARLPDQVSDAATLHNVCVLETNCQLVLAHRSMLISNEALEELLQLTEHFLTCFDIRNDNLLHHLPLVLHLFHRCLLRNSIF